MFLCRSRRLTAAGVQPPKTFGVASANFKYLWLVLAAVFTFPGHSAPGAGDGTQPSPAPSRKASKASVDMPAQGTPATANLPGKPFSTINSDLLNFDYEKRIATFEGNVVAVDPQLTLKCKTMKVFFSAKNSEVIRVEAIGDVHMFNEGKEAIGDKAIFTRETGVIVLSGSNCRLRDEKGNWIKSRGSGIIYNIHTKQMKVDKPEMVVQPSTGTEILKPTAPK
ncbi:MAG: hypothetical protein HY360_15030 [Verrucomicrobia bacterium]|nr:hypothetical protein [Verrucomicrobiota bacterium]